MASLSKYRVGWSIQWTDGKSRRTLYTGKMTKKQAGTMRGHVDALVSARKARTAIPDATADWVSEIDQTWREKLHGLGLIEKPAEAKEMDCPSVADFAETYVKNHGSVKDSTRMAWNRSRRLLATYFPDRPINSIDVGDAKDFRNWALKAGRIGRLHHGSGLADNTVRKMCRIACQIFEDAKDRELIQINPFDHPSIPKTVGENRSRDFEITREMATQILDACPDNECRLIFALSRYGGLRCPSEVLTLRWDGVLWDKDRMRVRSPKTERHEGREERLVPIFPEIRPYLEQAWDDAVEGEEFVVTKRRRMNLRALVTRIIERAGLKVWPKVFQNMRATRETELADEHPLQVVCAWIGNSPVIAQRHYLRVRESDFQKAVLQNVLRKEDETSENKCHESTSPPFAGSTPAL